MEGDFQKLPGNLSTREVTTTQDQSNSSKTKTVKQPRSQNCQKYRLKMTGLANFKLSAQVKANKTCALVLKIMTITTQTTTIKNII